jgi:uncharacterized membrane protein YdcZ (DUF606 family)
MDYLKYALWALLSGSLIPILGIINGRLGRKSCHSIATLKIRI